MDLTLEVAMISCPEREPVRARALQDFAESDWGQVPRVLENESTHPLRLERIRDAWRTGLTFAAESDARVVLIIEDDVSVNRHLLHNLRAWRPLNEIDDDCFFGSLYNPGVPRIRDRSDQNYFWARPEQTWGAQAILVSPRIAQLILRLWSTQQVHADHAMARIAATRTPVVYHSPSLVEHCSSQSTWHGLVHRARDFDAHWCAGAHGLTTLQPPGTGL